MLFCIYEIYGNIHELYSVYGNIHKLYSVYGEYTHYSVYTVFNKLVLCHQLVMFVLNHCKLV